MATNLTISLATQIRGTFSNALDLSTPVEAITYNAQLDFTNGTGVNQANKVWHDQRTGTGHTLDLTTGLTDPWGNNIVFTKLRGFLFRCITTTAGVIVDVGGSFFSQAGLLISVTSVPAGGFWSMVNPVDGWIVDSTFKTITLSGTGATFDIFLIGSV